jgi:hypothetical protein
MPRQVMRWTMAGFYTLAGVVHITAPDKFLSLERSNLAKIGRSFGDGFPLQNRRLWGC